ncbi:fractalkine [Canis lupus baileyi]|uniref:C-C motif chemokine 17 n=2 Tax=Canis lupus familiaris TaxID=9615 RepID=A0A8C0YVN8_CANLF|nr:fractalkine precursor [Canis lupus familiaris]BAL46483.1 chemokine (C-X3-C motif) ligand 1 [Canis lupus familiaris]|eukprot:NP_001271385.1 fractalkine precursor [Canis lupus familiaris]
MAPPPLSWLLRLAALCHLTALLAGQHLGVKKCNVTCHKMTSEIPVALLVHYQRNQESCGKPAIILKTKQNRIFCADPKERWVQKAIAHLEHQIAVTIRNGGTFEKQIGVGEPRTTPATRGMDRSAVTEPKSTQENSGQEAQRASGTSPELSTGVADSRGTRFPSTSKAPDGGPPAGSQKTEFFSAATLTATTSQQSSAAYKPGSGLWTEGKASEALPTQASSTQASSTQAPSTQTPSTQASSTQAPPTQAPSTQTLPTHAPPTHAPPTPTPTISHTASENRVDPEGRPVWIKGDNPTPENSLGPKEMSSLSAHMDAFRGPDHTPHLSTVLVSSPGVPSREPVASGSWVSKAEEPIHATVDPQRLGILITPVPDSQAATRRQAVGLLAFLGLLFCLGVAMFAYQSLQGCSRKMAGDMVEGLRYVPRSCGSNSYVLVPV